VKYAIYFSAYYPTIPDQSDPAVAFGSVTPYYHDILIENLTAVNSHYAGIMIGVPEKPLYAIRMRNVSISASSGLTIRNATVDTSATSVKVTSGQPFIYQANGVLTEVRTRGAGAVPAEFGLSQNYPNPFNPTTTIHYRIGIESLVKLSVVDVLGREVAQLVNAPKAPGSYAVEFDARNVGSGMYFYRLDAGTFHTVGKMLIIR